MHARSGIRGRRRRLFPSSVYLPRQRCHVSLSSSLIFSLPLPNYPYFSLAQQKISIAHSFPNPLTSSFISILCLPLFFTCLPYSHSAISLSFFHHIPLSIASMSSHLHQPLSHQFRPERERRKHFSSFFNTSLSSSFSLLHPFAPCCPHAQKRVFPSLVLFSILLSHATEEIYVAPPFSLLQSTSSST